MQTGNPMPSSASDFEWTGNSSKLVSLLALAAGAVAIPQTGNADIIYTDLSSNPVLVGFSPGYSGGTYIFTNLPGNVLVGFATHSNVVYTYYGIGGLKTYRTVAAGKMGTV